jgi:hypothetical protein
MTPRVRHIETDLLAAAALHGFDPEALANDRNPFAVRVYSNAIHRAIELRDEELDKLARRIAKYTNDGTGT